jgi:ABC-type Fe3+-siderophore transport system permease subunit
VAEPDALPDPHEDEHEQEAEVRPLPVLAEPRPIERVRPVSLPAAVAAATGGFLLGVACFLLVRVLRRPRAAHSLRLGGGRSRRAEVAASRSFLVDIHLLKDR